MDLFSHTLSEEVTKLKKAASQEMFNRKYGSGSESGSECEMQSGDENSDNPNSNNPDYKYYMKDVLKYMISMVEIIEKVHEKGVIHRDIKPENFMISQLRIQDHQTHQTHQTHKHTKHTGDTSRNWTEPRRSIHDKG